MHTKVLLGAMLLATIPCWNCAPPARAAKQSVAETERSDRHKTEIRTPAEGQPLVVVTNLYERPMTAFILEVFSSSHPENRNGKLGWDAYIGRQPVSMDGSVSVTLPHVEDRSYPDNAVIAAAVWEDGSTEGPPELLNLIFGDRIREQAAYEWSMALLRKGLAENWGRAQYLAVFENPENQPANYRAAGLTIKSTVEANRADDPGRLHATLQKLLETFTDRYEALIQAKPDAVEAISENHK
jgi:hypothetical protein